MRTSPSNAVSPTTTLTAFPNLQQHHQRPSSSPPPPPIPSPSLISVHSPLAFLSHIPRPVATTPLLTSAPPSSLSCPIFKPCSASPSLLARRYSPLSHSSSFLFCFVPRLHPLPGRFNNRNHGKPASQDDVIHTSTTTTTTTISSSSSSSTSTSRTAFIKRPSSSPSSSPSSQHPASQKHNNNNNTPSPSPSPRSPPHKDNIVTAAAATAAMHRNSCASMATSTDTLWGSHAIPLSKHARRRLSIVQRLFVLAVFVLPIEAQGLALRNRTAAMFTMGCDIAERLCASLPFPHHEIIALLLHLTASLLLLSP